MPSIFQGFQQGRQLRAGEEQQQFNMDIVQKGQNMAEAQARKQDVMFGQQQRQFEQQQAAYTKKLATDEATNAIKWMMPLQTDKEFEPNRAGFMEDLGAAFGEENISPYKEMPLAGLQAVMRDRMSGNVGKFTTFEHGGKRYSHNNETNITEEIKIVPQEGVKDDITEGVMWNPDSGERVPVPQTREEYDARVTEGYVPLGKGDITIGGEKLSGADNTQIKDYKTTLRMFGMAADRINQIEEIMIDNPDANTAVASLSGSFTGLLHEAKAAAKTLGFKDEEKALSEKSITEYNGMLETLGIDNAKLRSSIIGLAYMKAKAIDGRVSGPDFEFQVKALGAKSSNPAIFMSVLSQEGEMMNKDIQTFYGSLSDNIKDQVEEPGSIYSPYKKQKGVEYIRKTKPNAEGVVMGLNPDTNEWEITK